MGELNHMNQSWSNRGGSSATAVYAEESFSNLDASGGSCRRQDLIRGKLQQFLAMQKRCAYYSYPYFEILLEIEKRGRANTPVSVSGLGERTRIAQATVLHAIDELERARLVERNPGPSGRREAYVAVTEAGSGIVRNFVNQLLKGIPDMI